MKKIILTATILLLSSVAQAGGLDKLLATFNDNGISYVQRDNKVVVAVTTDEQATFVKTVEVPEDIEVQVVDVSLD